MTQNPYSPPTMENRASGTSRVIVGDFEQRLGNRAVLYVSAVFLGLLSAVGTPETRGFAAVWTILSLFTLALHCMALLSFRGVQRVLVISLNAMLVIASWVLAFPQLVIANLSLHAVIWIGFFVHLERERRYFTRVLALPNPIEVLEQELREKGDSINRLQILGVLYGQKSQYHDALSIMQRCLQLDRYNSGTHSNMAWLLGEVGAYEEAEDAFRRLLTNRLTPDLKCHVETNYCKLLARTARLSECSERLGGIEQTIRTHSKISKTNRQALETAVLNARALLTQLSQETF